jgi:thiosulfate/3-mercaptopyruvate sulfurtransferase
MVGALGVTNTARIVVYDQRGLFSAARAWWMFRIFGHDEVAVLDGGLPAWIAAGGALETGAPAAAAPAVFTATFRPGMVRSLDQMKANLITHEAIVVDARATGRFNGSVPEPRAGMKSGHIPGARSIPFGEVLDAGKMRSADELRARFAQAGIDGGTPVITSCGSGVTAAVLSLAMVVAGLPEAPIYDGSWSEWGSRDDTPVEV